MDAVWRALGNPGDDAGGSATVAAVTPLYWVAGPGIPTGIPHVYSAWWGRPSRDLLAAFDDARSERLTPGLVGWAGFRE